MKNQAFALLYRKYIREAKVPWKFPEQNPSNIRIEKRTISKNHDIPVLVDDFEHTAITLGIVSTTGKVLGTGRMLVRDEISHGRLELECYSSLPHRIKAVLEEKKCHIEINRCAIDHCLRGKGCAMLLYSSILSHLTSLNNDDCVVWTQPLSLFHKSRKVPGYSLLCAMNKIIDLGSFEYTKGDAEPAMVGLTSKLVLFVLATLNAMKSGTIQIPSIFWSTRQIGP